MWSSRELALVIVLAILGVLYGVFVLQLGRLLTSIPGLNYLLSVGVAIWISLSFLLFNGKRWRLLATVTIFVLLTIPTYVMGTPYDLVARMPVILIILLIDIIFNSVYAKSRKKGILRLIIILSIVNLIGDMAFRVMIYPFVYSSNFVTFFYGISLYLLPVVIVEAIIGGYVGYKIFQRIKNLSFFDIR